MLHSKCIFNIFRFLFNGLGVVDTSSAQETECVTPRESKYSLIVSALLFKPSALNSFPQLKGGIL
ncbi:MAG: hypothetical protein B6D45_01550 [Ignavibacteriales bacterium UTCHB3]|nr:MAG: hypothetical protein B6D45_01550 [Ignavibacteriales bacterium UTCHB3]